MAVFFRVLFLTLGLVFASVVLAPVSAQAQQEQTLPDYETWEKVANQAEIALSQKRASNAALEGLRETLVDWRSQFLAARDANAVRIDTLKNQIAALGPPPETEGEEPAELAKPRAQLTEELAALSAPQRVADAAYNRADGLIKETDKIIRNRSAAQLLENQGSPLSPSRWSEAFSALSISLGQAANETSYAIETNRDQFLSLRDLPRTVFYFLVAAVLLIRGRGWMVRLTGLVQGDAADAQSGIRGFLVSLGQMILPIIGVYALIQALSASGLLGFRGQLLADGLIPIGIAFFSARWLALRLLPLVRKRQGFLQVSDEKAASARRYAGILALVWGGDQLLSRLADFEGFSAAIVGVLQFPLVLIAGLALVRFGQILRASVAPASETPPADWSFRNRVTGLAGSALIGVGLGGPLAMALGYVPVGTAIVFSTILTLANLALVIVLAGLFRDIYAFATRQDDETVRQSLVPVLVSFILVILSLPGLALIWGARFSDLTELWTRFQEGVQLGDTRITPGAFLTFAVVFVIGYMATRLLQSTLKTSVLPKTRMDPGGQSAIVSGIGYLGIFLAAVIAISTAGIDLSSLAIVAGALSVGIGFGLQNIVSNFVSGIILLIERPITEGDWISVGGYEGTVREISVRSTRIETFDRCDVIIPNGDLVSGAVTNYTRGNLVGRAVISVGVAYGTDTRRVHDILAEAALVHPLVYSDPPPGVHLVGFGADSLDFQIRAVLRDVNYILTVKSEILHEINRRFAEEGIEIPFAQRDVWLRNPESLSGRGQEDPEATPEG